MGTDTVAGLQAGCAGQVVEESMQHEAESQWWHQIGPQYRSNDNGDGPAHVDDADIEKTEEDPQWHQIGPQYRSNNAGDGPAHVDDAEIEKTNLKTMARLGLGMGPEFPSDVSGDGPDFDDMEISDNSSSVGDSDCGSTGGSDSSYDPDRDKKLAQKKRLESQKKKRKEMGPEARLNEYESRTKKRK